jgi:DNA-binding XRE family transcriptional regulator
MNTPKTEQTQQRTDQNERDAGAENRAAKESPVTTTGDERARPAAAAKSSVEAKGRGENNVRQLRMERMMSKAELARRAGMSTLTIDRVERGMACRMDTKRKILEALGLTPSDRVRVFGDED